MIRSKLFGVVLGAAFLGLAACQSGNDAPEETAAPVVDTVALLDILYDEYDEDFLEMNPIFATFRGDNRFNDQWGPYDSLSDEYAAAALAMNKDYLERLLSIGGSTLSGQELLSYEIFKLERENAIERSEQGYDDFESLMPVSQFFSMPSFLVMLGSGATAQPFVTPEDYDNWIKRSTGFVEHVDLSITRMREGVELGVVRPRILMEKALPQLQAQIVDDPEQSDFWGPIARMPESIGEEDRARIEAEYRDHISKVLVPSYKKLHDYIADDYLPNTRETIGQGDIPGGAAYYAFKVRESTTTDLTPEEIHEIGKREAARLFEEMKKVRDEVGFEGDIQAFFEFLKTDPQFTLHLKKRLLRRMTSYAMSSTHCWTRVSISRRKPTTSLSRSRNFGRNQWRRRNIFPAHRTAHGLESFISTLMTYRLVPTT